MSMDTYFIRCALAAFVVFGGFQNILIAGSDDKRSSEFSDECIRELALCTLKTLQPYEGLKNDDVLAKARATSLAKHCNDWGEAISCNRQSLKSEVCQNITYPGTKIVQMIEVIDIVVNYVCKENFRGFNGIYRCLLDPATGKSVTKQCKGVEFNATDVCQKMPELIECAAKGLTNRCGLEAGKVARELGSKVSGILIEATYDRKCPPPKRDDITDLLKSFFFRK